MGKTIIYLRVSTKEQNPEQQLRQCKGLCKRKGFEDVSIYRERVSAWNSKEKPKYEEMLSQARKGIVTDIVVWDFDRLQRNRKLLFELIKGYSKLGVKFWSYRQSWFEQINNVPSPWNEILHDFLLNVIGWMNEEESTKKSERIKKAYNYKKKHKPKTMKWGRPKISKYNHDKIIELYTSKQYYSINQISKMMRVGYGTCYRVIQKHKLEKDTLNKKHTPSPKRDDLGEKVKKEVNCHG